MQNINSEYLKEYNSELKHIVFTPSQGATVL